MEFWFYGLAILFLAFLGALAAKTSSSSVLKAVLRVTFWGTIATLLTALVAHFFVVNIV